MRIPTMADQLRKVITIINKKLLGTGSEILCQKLVMHSTGFLTEDNWKKRRTDSDGLEILIDGDWDGHVRLHKRQRGSLSVGRERKRKFDWRLSGPGNKQAPSSYPNNIYVMCPCGSATSSLNLTCATAPFSWRSLFAFSLRFSR